jgi:hypothetical protein
MLYTSKDQSFSVLSCCQAGFLIRDPRFFCRKTGINFALTQSYYLIPFPIPKTAGFCAQPSRSFLIVYQKNVFEQVAVFAARELRHLLTNTVYSPVPVFRMKSCLQMGASLRVRR